VDVFGSFALLLAFICAVYAFVGGIFAIRTRHPLLIRVTRQAGMGHMRADFYCDVQPGLFVLQRQLLVAYVVAHSIAIFRRSIRFRRCGRAGRLAAVLELSARDLRFSALFAYRNKNAS